jgi:hypothetical protein
MTNLLTERNLADFMQVSVGKLRKDREKKRGVPYSVISRSVRYSMDDVKSFLDQNKFNSSHK